MTGSRKRRVDDAWAQLNVAEILPQSAAAQLKASKAKQQKGPGKKAKKKANKVLSGIFGKTVAGSIISKVTVPGTREQTYAAAAADTASGGTTTAAVAARAVLKAPKKKQLTETKKFAGKQIT